MGEYGYFQKALADFTYEAASGGAIRHLTDMGYTVKQIVGRLDFPTPYERVQKGVWERLLETGVILTEEPGGNCGKGILQEEASAWEEGYLGKDGFPQKKGSLGKDGFPQKEGSLWRADDMRGRREPVKKAKYVREYDKYGKASFRRVEETHEEKVVVCWKDYYWKTGVQKVDELYALLREERQKNDESKSYMSCDFGLISRRKPEKFQAIMAVLPERQREYISGLPWEECRLYHRLDARMREILLRLYHEGMYQGECYFMESGDRIIIRTE